MNKILYVLLAIIFVAGCSADVSHPIVSAPTQNPTSTTNMLNPCYYFDAATFARASDAQQVEMIHLNNYNIMLKKSAKCMAEAFSPTYYDHSSKEVIPAIATEAYWEIQLNNNSFVDEAQEIGIEGALRLDQKIITRCDPGITEGPTCVNAEYYIEFPATEDSPMRYGWKGSYAKIDGAWKIVSGD